MQTLPTTPIRGLTSGRSLASRIRLLAGLTLAAFAVAPGLAATYYVSSSAAGSTNQGTLENPWTSLATVNATAFAPGDQILLKRGDTWTGAQLTVSSSGDAANPIVYGAYGTGAKPVIDGNNAVGVICVFLGNRDYVTIQDLDLRNANKSGLSAQTVHHVQILRVDVAQTGTTGMVFKQGGHLLVDGCTVTRAGSSGGIYCNGSADEPLHDVIIQNCHVYDLTGSAGGIVLHQDSTSALNPVGSNFILRHNLTDNCQEQGFGIVSGSNILLENNESRNNETGAMSLGHSANNVTVRYHKSFNDPRVNSGSTLKLATPNATIEYSTFTGSSNWNKPIVLITPSLLQGASPPAADAQPENIVLRNNVFLWNTASAGNVFVISQNNTVNPTIQNLTMKNNLWTSTPAGTGAWTLNFTSAGAQPNAPGFLLDRNLYHRPTGAVGWIVWGTSYDFATYQSTFGRDLNGLEADPLFVDSAAADYHLQAGSPAIDAGENIGLAVDFDGAAVPQGAGRDLGAYEFPVVIAAPTGLTATALSAREIQLAWTDNTADETAFRLQRKAGEGGAYADTTPATVAANTVTFNDTNGVADSTTYTYQVRAETPAGSSAWSNEATATTPEADTTAPEITSLTATPDHLWPPNHKMVAVTLTATATDDRDPAPVTSILSVTSSEAALGEPDWEITGDLTLNLRAERAGNGPGRLYTITVQSTDSSGNSSTATVLIPVGHNNDTKAPTVALTAPAGGAPVAGSVALAATATDNNGVVGVQFQLNGANLGTEDSSAPYGLAWNTTAASNGSHTLTAIARDENGSYATSAPVTVFVDNAAPAVSVTAPTVGSLLTGSGIVLSASATDNVAVAAVQFKIDGANVGPELAAAPYELAWDSATVADGAHTLTAVARDTLGNTATSATVAVTTDNLPPAVALTVPADGALVGGSAVTLTAAASDLVGVAGVSFLVDGSPVGSEDTTAPYSVTWDSTAVSNGSHTLTAVARDLVGHTTASAPVTVVVDNLAPTVAVTAPAAGSTVSGSTVAVAGTATDNLAVAGVQFQLDGVNLGAEDTTAPYGVTWNTTTAANGAHALTAAARDAAGNTTVSAAVGVTVSNLALPVTYQAEALTRTASPGDALSLITPAGVSGSAVRLIANAVGDWVEFTVNVPASLAGNSNVNVRVHRNAFRAISVLLIDGGQLGAPYDAYAAAAGFVSVDFGTLNLSAGSHTFRFQITGRNPLSNPADYQLGIDYLTLTPQ